MQSESFDNKINEAADRHHPAYDEKAWIGMEKLLDKHLPQKKDNRRRIIFFLFLFLLLGGAGLFINQYRKQNKVLAKSEQAYLQPTSSVIQKKDTGELVNENNGPVKSQNAIVNINEKSSKDKAQQLTDNRNPSASSNLTDTKTFVSIISSLAINSNKETQESGVTIIKGTITKKTASRKTGADKGPVNDMAISSAKNNRQPGIPVGLVKEAGNNSVITKEDTNNKALENNTMPALLAGNGNVETNQIAEKKKEESKKDTTLIKAKIKSKKTNTFFVTVSAGPDVSFAGSDAFGKVKVLAGAGVGYTFKDRLTIRAGFYKSQKIYSASPYEYHAPDIFYTYYPYLEKVDADCKVYEIPLAVSYNFGKPSSYNWFASAGISSYLMKNETYNYSYKTSPAGPLMNRSRTINNENSNLFSVLTLSGGYKKTFSRSFSLMIEPYFKLPISGVGYGKVKLNSTGVLISAAISPFSNFKNKK